MAGVVVVGSANVDLNLAVQRIPGPGETVLATALTRGPGGKGANQAVAAARAGASTAFVACLGRDDSARLLRDALTEAGVSLDLLTTTDTPTGTAVITVDQAGENAITVAPSANTELVLTPGATAAVGQADVVLAQLEIPLDTVRVAAGASRYFVLNAAPATELDDDLLANVDLLVANEHEAVVVGGSDRAGLLARVPAAVVTLGGAGALVLRRGLDDVRVPAVEVDVVDTTAAGDTFCGVLAAALAGRMSLLDAVRRATVAASLSVQVPGAIPSVPHGDAIDERHAQVYP